MEGQGAKCQVRIARATEHFRAIKVLSAIENNSYLFFALLVLNLKLLESQKEAEARRLTFFSRLLEKIFDWFLEQIIL